MYIRLTAKAQPNKARAALDFFYAFAMVIGHGM